MSRALLLSFALVGALGAPAHAADVEAGRAVYDANCLACHGKTAAGDGPAAVALRPAPTDLTAESWWKNKSDNDLRKIIRTGNPGTAMMSFKHITGDDMDNLVAYLRTLAPAPAAP